MYKSDEDFMFEAFNLEVCHMLSNELIELCPLYSSVEIEKEVQVIFGEEAPTHGFDVGVVAVVYPYLGKDVPHPLQV